MKTAVSSIWNVPVPDLFWQELNALFDSHGSDGVFFRADDIGRDDDRFHEMVSLFRQFKIPLALAIVPAWVEQDDAALAKCSLPDDPLFTWQMHGAAHVNHAVSGKKSEWGVDRCLEDKRSALVWGRETLQRLLGKAPVVFTPPWNRCDAETMTLLPAAGFTGISRGRKARPATPPDLIARDICVDLHTRKEADAQRGWEQLLVEFREGVGRGDCGVMLHHQRMNTRAVEFLERLLSMIQAGALR